MSSIRLLRTFVAVAAEGSFAAAAPRVALTQAAVGQQMRLLESELRRDLFVRQGKAVVLGDAGRELLPQVRRLVALYDQMLATAPATEPMAGTLNLGAVVSAVRPLIQATLALKARHPALELHVSAAKSIELLARVRSGELDAAIVVKPEFALAKACEWRPLRAEPLLVIAPTALRERDPNVLLAREPFIRLSRDTAGGRLVDRYLRREGIVPQERFEVTSLFAITRLVDRGLGVALIPDWPPPWPEGVRLRRIPVDSPEHARHVGVVYPRASVRAGPAQAFVEAATAVAAGPLSRT